METQKVYIDTEYIKLDCLLKFSGAVVTGGNAKIVIKDSLVKVNGEICTMRGKKMYPNDTAEYNGIIYEVLKIEDQSS